ncbi:MAG: hypothetical protein H6740_22445 [Alphaproteobacteria bacterium]|nr:hypothetical protein [Alphaproteobacteria bacterium]
MHWHRWSVLLRAEAFGGADAATLRGLLLRALEGQAAPLPSTEARGAWLEGPGYEPRVVLSLIAAFKLLFEALMRALDGADAPAPERLGALFDAVEFLPFVLVGEGPEQVEAYLEGYAASFAELRPMAQAFRGRGA